MGLAAQQRPRPGGVGHSQARRPAAPPEHGASSGPTAPSPAGSTSCKASTAGSSPSPNFSMCHFREDSATSKTGELSSVPAAISSEWGLPAPAGPAWTGSILLREGLPALAGPTWTGPSHHLQGAALALGSRPPQTPITAHPPPAPGRSPGRGPPRGRRDAVRPSRCCDQGPPSSIHCPPLTPQPKLNIRKPVTV